MSEIKVVIVATGDEITNGDIADTNGAWLSSRLFHEGISVWGHEAIPDSPQRLVAAVQRLSGEVDMAVFCGGLGPTDDDYTVDAVASLLGTSPVHHQPTLERARRLFADRGTPFVANGARQCRYPEGTQVCPNPMGLAPAFRVAIGRCIFFFLPGPPTEFQACCEACVLPEVRQRLRSEHAPVALSRRFRTTELGESILAQTVAPVVAQFPDARFGWRAVYPEVWFKVLVTASTQAQAEAKMALVAARTADAVGPRHLFATDDETMEEVVGKELARHGLTLGTAESCTAGLLAGQITEVPGSSAWFKGGFVTYSNELKISLLGVPESLLAAHGAVSAPCAEAMALGARERLGTDLALAITGIAGPGGGTQAKPVGTVFIALATQRGVQVETPRLRGSRDRIRAGAAFYALNMIRRELQGLDD